MDCKSCFNNTGTSCRTMTKPPKILFCHMTLDQVIRAETDILRYLEHLKDGANRERKKSLFGAIERQKKEIRELREVKKKGVGK